MIYTTDFNTNLQLSGNDHLRLASTFHGLYTIAAELSPTMGTPADPASGIKVLETDSFRLECYESPTGVKFYAVAEKNQQNMEATLKSVYELYGDYVLKNPFYEIDQPIRCELFEQQLTALVSTKTVK